MIELKILHEGYDYTQRKGLKQTAAYIDKWGTKDGHLVIFNRDPEIDWEEKITYKLHQYEGKDIHVWGM